MIRYFSTLFVLAAFLAEPVVAASQSGRFSGASGHKTSGTVAVNKSAKKITIRLGNSFSLDRAPDPYVTLGRGNRPVAGGYVGKLRKKRGRQAYSVRANAKRSGATQVIIWCRRYRVPLGIAPLN